MKIVPIALEKLIEHPANANVMSNEFLAKLRAHIADHGYYEPLVVRSHPRVEGCFEVISGHHRKLVLEQLNYKEANCVVWDVSDEETLMLLATLNRLSGQDHPRLRAALLEKVKRRYEDEALRMKLPEKREQLQKLLALNKPPQPLEPQELGELPQVMTFFVSSQQKAMVEQSLRQMQRQMGRQANGRKLRRGDLLACLAETVLNRGGCSQETERE